MKTCPVVRGPWSRGVAAIEMAILLPMFAVMIFGTVELGRAIYSYNTLDKAVRDAARLLSQNGPGDVDIAKEAICLATHGTTICTNDPATAIVPDLTFDKVKICDAAPSGPSACPDHSVAVDGVGTVNLVSVSIVDYRYNALTKFFFPYLDFNKISVTMRAQL